MKEFHSRFGKYPKRVQADEGKEFWNINFSEYLKHKNIEFFATKSTKKAAQSLQKQGTMNWNLRKTTLTVKISKKGQTA